MRVTTRFHKVKLRVSKTGTCHICEHSSIRVKTFWQTANPFNKNASGFQKTPEEIREELRAEGAKWEPDFAHEDCVRALRDQAKETASFVMHPRTR